MGDSTTFGEGVRDTEGTFVSVVERLLNERQRAVEVRTFNYGASAYNVNVMAATLRHRVLAIDPDLVFMVVGLDDFFLARTPTIDPFGYLSDRVPWILPPDSVLRTYMRRVHTLYVIRAIVVDWGSGRADAYERIRLGEEPAAYRGVLEFAGVARRHGIPGVVVYLPSSRVEAAGHLIRRMRGDGITVVDLASIRQEFTLEAFRASRFDPHASAAVHRRMGEALADAILELGLARLATTSAASR